MWFDIKPYRGGSGDLTDFGRWMAGTAASCWFASHWIARRTWKLARSPSMAAWAGAAERSSYLELARLTAECFPCHEGSTQPSPSDAANCNSASPQQV